MGRHQPNHSGFEMELEFISWSVLSTAPKPHSMLPSPKGAVMELTPWKEPLGWVGSTVIQ